MISAVTFIYWPEEVDVLDGALKSLSFCDEIIVIDNGAPEEVVKIAKKYTSKIYKSADSSFAARHNFGTSKASGDWILFVDSDERVSKKLADEIRKVDGRFNSYKVNRVNFFLGKEVKFGDRYPDLVTRLFKREKLKGWTGEIHESSVIGGDSGVMEGNLYHFTHRDIFSMVEKTINFSEREATIRLQSGHPPIVGWRLIRVFVTELYNRIVNMQGFRQGTEGWIDGIFQAFSLFIVYARLWERQQKIPLKDKYKILDKKISEGEI